MVERRRKTGALVRLTSRAAVPAAVGVVFLTAAPVAVAGAGAPVSLVLAPTTTPARTPTTPAATAVVTPSSVAGTCSQPGADPNQAIAGTPWHQKWLSPQRTWPLSTGAGVRVAVVDSGVDANHVQLAGVVQGGTDMLTGGGSGTLDCVGHGTAVASIIAAKPAKGVGFQGLAPGAQIVSVRVTEREGDDQGSTKEGVDPARFAKAIRWAADQGIRVINLSVVMYTSSKDVEDAVRYARSKNAILVAAVGNKHRTDGQPDPTPYPAAYEGVIGVGAIDEQGKRVTDSQVGSYVDLAAPGGDITAATRVAGHQQWSGTSFAAPMVAAAVALMLSAHPSLTADEVARQLAATADPSRGGAASEAYGHGIVNLYRAVSERLNTQQPAALAPAPERTYNAGAVARDRHWALLGKIAGSVAVAVVIVILVIVAAAATVPRARRLGWRPVRAAPLPASTSPLDEIDGEALAEAFVRLPTDQGH